jgi:hypothetical protein
MLESRSCYFPDERGSSPYKWCVKFVLGQDTCEGYTVPVDRGIIGMDTKQAAAKWLERTMQEHRDGNYFSGQKVVESGVYMA